MQSMNLKGPFEGLQPPITTQGRKVDIPWVVLQHKKVVYCVKNDAQVTARRAKSNIFTAFCAASSGVQNLSLSVSEFKIFKGSTDYGSDREIKIKVDVAGARTQEIFDNVFTKLVEAAQPIPGFRRVKGGALLEKLELSNYLPWKTPDIPKDVLLQIIGPAKIHKEAILSIINTAVAEIVAKEDLNVSRDLRVEQSYDVLEAAFVPGKGFSFEATIRLQQSSRN